MRRFHPNLLLLLALAGCGLPPSHFFERLSENVDRPRVRVVNETAGAIYVTLEPDAGDEAKAEDGEHATKVKIEVAPWSYAIQEVASGSYGYQIFIEGRREFPAAWFSHGPTGRLTLRRGHRYAWRWRPR